MALLMQSNKGWRPVIYKLFMFLLAINGTLLWSNVASSHARLRIVTENNQIPRLTPRNASDNNKGGATTGDIPCGPNSTTRDTNPVVLVAGETVEVEIEETINHMGRYDVFYSPDGVTGFEENLLLSIVDDTQGTPSKANPNRYSGTITVPLATCTNCTLQMVQVMVNANNGAETFYKSCVDIVITDQANLPPTKPAGLQILGK